MGVAISRKARKVPFEILVSSSCRLLFTASILKQYYVGQPLALSGFLMRTLSVITICFLFLFPEFDVTLGKLRFSFLDPQQWGAEKSSWFWLLPLHTSVRSLCCTILGSDLCGKEVRKQVGRSVCLTQHFSMEDRAILKPWPTVHPLQPGTATLWIWEPHSVIGCLENVWTTNSHSVSSVFIRCLNITPTLTSKMARIRLKLDFTEKTHFLSTKVKNLARYHENLEGSWM